MSGLVERQLWHAKSMASKSTPAITFLHLQERESETPFGSDVATWSYLAVLEVEKFKSI